VQPHDRRGTARSRVRCVHSQFEGAGCRKTLEEVQRTTLLATYAHKADKRAAIIDCRRAPPMSLDRQIRAFNPWAFWRYARLAAPAVKKLWAA